MDDVELNDMATINNLKEQLSSITKEKTTDDITISDLRKRVDTLEERLSAIEKTLSSLPFRLEGNKLTLTKPYTIDNVSPARSNHEVVTLSQIKAIQELCIITANTVVKEIKKIKERL
jgi:hypothetical protein